MKSLTVIETAQSGIATFDAILKPQKKVGQSIEHLGTRASKAQKVIKQLYLHPLTNAEKVSRVAGISLPTAYTLIEILEKKKILREITGAQRKRSYVFEEYVKLFR